MNSVFISALERSISKENHHGTVLNIFIIKYLLFLIVLQFTSAWYTIILYSG
jgi:hypothetical protein